MDPYWFGKDQKWYHDRLVELGANFQNIKNWASHYHYGTKPEDLVAASKRGIVYNPPGH